ncbi:MAG TPA: ATP-binding protein [Hanamia sp.]
MREYRILHLEDSHSDADVIKRVLLKANLNFQYFLADDKESFIRGLTDFKPDVILSDHALPQFDSVMAFDIYKEMKLEIPFILVTGSVSEEYAVEMIKKGIDDYLLKINLQRLPQAIKNAFDKRENEKKISQVEKDLKQSETNLRTIFENTSSGFLLLDKNLNVISFNNQMSYFSKELFGFDLQENVNFIAMLMPERQQELKNLFGMILKGETSSNETGHPQTDGKLIWYCVKGNPVLDQERNITGVCLTVDDITERKNAEEERSRLSSILEATSDFVGITGVDQRLSFLNTAGRKAMGYDEMEDLSQKKIVDFSPDWANEILLKEGIPAALKAGKWIGETAWFSKEGVETPVSQVIIAHNNSNGELQYLSTIARDITLQKETEQKLEQQNVELVFQNEEKEKRAAELAIANKELALSNTELERFAYIASHDLQEPLRMVTSFMNLLEKRMSGQLDDTSKQYIHYAADGAIRMKTLIQDLLMYSRIGTNKEDFTIVDLNEVMQYIIRVLEENIKETGTTITVKHLPVISANKTLINQLLVNLISNALKYHRDNDPEIEVGYNEDPRNWIFYVKDNGIGIDPKFFDKIFIIFQRLHINSEYSGTGIGLAICKKIVEIHKGKIWVESEQGKGSTFYFSIPKQNA